MPYVVSRLEPRKQKVDLISFLNDLVTLDMFRPPTVFQTTGTRTAYYGEIKGGNERLKELKVPQQIRAMADFYDAYKDMRVDGVPQYNYERQVELHSEVKANGVLDEEQQKSMVAELLKAEGYEYCNLYRTFYIPKRSSKPGHMKWRRIDAPSDELANALRKLKVIFEALMDGCTYHTAAFAYVQHRCPADAVRKHAANKSNWELKLDFSNFFGSVTPEFLYKMMTQIFPFSEMIKLEGGEDALRNCLSLCFLNGGLPQGTPISPLLTNIMMIPIDHAISKGLRNNPVEVRKDNGHIVKNDYVYTRYADDIAVSNRVKFDDKRVINYINRVLAHYDAPFKLNPEKTRFGSNAGANWMLGVMYNQNHEVTVGHRRKKRLKATIANYAMDRNNGKRWELADVQQLQGEISYCKSIEEKAIEQIINNYSEKFKTDITAAIKADIKAMSA